MAQTREQKAASIAEIKEKLEQTPAIYLTNCSGLTVAEANDLRGRFRKAQVDLKVIKNTLLRLAMEEIGGYEGVYEQLHGPTAVAFSEEPAAPARVIKKFTSDKRLERPELKAAFVDGACYPGSQLDVLASLKSKEELIADIAGLLLAPITNVVGALQAQGQNLVGALKTIAEKEA
jgi:large subunit ribosomal protein L10